MKTLQIVFLGLILLVVGVLAYQGHVDRQSTPTGSAEVGQPFAKFATSSTQVVDQYASWDVIATNTAAQYRKLQNKGPFDVYWNCNGDVAASSGQGSLLVASSTAEMKIADGTMCFGAINARTTNGTTTLLINEK